MLVDSLVVFDAPIHPKYRKLTQDWFMPRNLKRIEDEIRQLAHRTVDRMIEGPELDFVKKSQGLPLAGGDADPRRPARGRTAHEM